jgi:chitinase
VFKVQTDPSGKSGPFAFSKTQLVGYEDKASIETKAKYVIDSGFGGMAAWTVDLDDFLNRCCGESFPLLRAINRGLGRKVDKSTSGCTRPQKPVTPVAPVMTIPEESGLYRPPSTPAMISQTSPASSTIWWSPTTTKPTTTRTTTRRATTTAATTTTATTTESTTPETTKKPSTTRRTTRRTTKTTTLASTTEEAAEEAPAEAILIPPPGISMPISLPGNGCIDGEFKPVESNCNAFYQCSLGELVQQYCAGGLHWNNVVMSCDWPSSAMCLETEVDNVGMDHGGVAPTQTTSPSQTTSPTRKTTKKITTRKTTTASSLENIEAPPKRTTKRPAPNTTKKRRTTQRTSARPAYPPPEDNRVSCVPGQYYPTKKCETFSICVNGVMLEQDCAPGLQWDQEIMTCDWKANVNCVSTKDYFKLFALKYGGYTKLNPDDPCNGEDFVPYPGDCTQYLRCVWGKLQGLSCPQDLHWNQESKACDWPEKANCDAGDSSNNEEGSEGIDEASNSVDEGNSPDESGEMPEPVSIPDTAVDVPAVPDYVAPEPVDPDSGYYKLVCYFTNWAWYRPGMGKYTPDDINTDLCTHIVYGFAVLDGTSLTIKTHDSWADIDNKFYERVVALKSKGVRVTVAIGGWNDSLGDKYSRLVRSAAARAKFIRNIVQFIEKYNFEGLDLDWEYPVCWQVDCSKGKADEKEGFANLVKELSAEFKPRGWLLSAAVSPSKAVIDAGYDVPTLAKHFDWIAVMTYDYHGQWDKKTGHVAPLFYHPEDEFDYFNANYTMHYWIKLGAPSRKLVMGMPLYGQAFTLSDAKNNGLNARAPGPGQAGEFTRSAGFLAYYEVSLLS